MPLKMMGGYLHKQDPSGNYKVVAPQLQNKVTVPLITDYYSPVRTTGRAAKTMGLATLTSPAWLPAVTSKIIAPAFSEMLNQMGQTAKTKLEPTLENIQTQNKAVMREKILPPPAPLAQEIPGMKKVIENLPQADINFSPQSYADKARQSLPPLLGELAALYLRNQPDINIPIGSIAKNVLSEDPEVTKLKQKMLEGNKLTSKEKDRLLREMVYYVADIATPVQESTQRMRDIQGALDNRNLDYADWLKDQPIAPQGIEGQIKQIGKEIDPNLITEQAFITSDGKFYSTAGTGHARFLGGPEVLENYLSRGGIRLYVGPETGIINVEMMAPPTSQQIKALEKLPTNRIYFYDVAGNRSMGEATKAQVVDLARKLLRRGLATPPISPRAAAEMVGPTLQGLLK